MLEDLSKGLSVAGKAVFIPPGGSQAANDIKAGRFA